MAVEQAGTNPPEPQSYDADMMADVRGAFEEVSKAPEPEVKAEPKAEPEVKAEPVEAKADHPDDPTRYADGKFKPTKADAEPPKEPDPTKIIEPVQQEQQPAPTQAGNPPGGFSVQTKAAWDKIVAQFPTLASDIAKREKEIADGFAQYEGMRELRPYVDMARQSGRSLKQALDSYVATERELYGPQPLAAILRLANVAGYSPQRLVQELQIGPSTGQIQDQGSSFDPSMMQQWLNPLAQEVNQLKSLFQQQSEGQRTREMTTIATVVDRFKSDPAHRYYDNLEPRMAQLFETGAVSKTGDYAKDLQAAYEMACWENPEIRELLLNERIAKTEETRKAAEKEAAEKAKQASRSITGSPSPGPVREGDGSGDSIEDDVRRAYRAHAA